VVERVVLLSEEDRLNLDFISTEMGYADPDFSHETMKEKMEGLFRAIEKQMIIEALEKSGNNRTEAAKLLGISRRTLQKKIKEYGL
jgi:transcriptional regulator with PAS, ATPase and Fis domain